MLIKTSKASFKTVVFVASILFGVVFAPNAVLAKKDAKSIKAVETTRNVNAVKGDGSVENMVGNIDISSEKKKASSNKSDIVNTVNDTKNIKNTADSEGLKSISISAIPVENKADKANAINKTNKINETDKTNIANVATDKEAKDANGINRKNKKDNTNSVKTDIDVEAGANEVTTPTSVVGNYQVVTEAADNLNVNANKDITKNSNVQLAGDTAGNRTVGKKVVAEDLKSITFDDTVNVAKVQKIQKTQENTKKTKAAEIVPKAAAISGAKEISFADNEQITVFLSNRDINRVLVQGDKIQSVNGPTGLYIAKNGTNGSAYISLYSDSTFTIFMSTVKGHNFSLLVNPRSVAGKTVILIPTTPFPLESNFGETKSYQRTLVTLISSMINNEALEDYSYSETNKTKKFKKTDFYGIADIKPTAFYSGSQFIGVVSEVRNKSRKPVSLKPSYFYKPGVRAISLSSHTLVPADTCLLYQVVSRR